MKKIITLVTAILLVCGSAIVLAQPINKIIATKSQFPIVINGMNFNSQKNVVCVDGTTYVPVRDFCKALSRSGKQNVSCCLPLNTSMHRLICKKSKSFSVVHKYLNLILYKMH